MNGVPIALADFERRAGELERALVGEGLVASTQEGQAALAQMKRDLLESMIDVVLLEQAAPSLGVEVKAAEVEAQVQADISAGGGVAAFEEWLRSTGQTRSEYAHTVGEALLLQRVVDAVGGSAPQVAEQVHVRRIVVDSLEDARDVLDQLAEGADFSALAQELSLDATAKATGGDLGWLLRGLVEPELEDVMFALQPGEVSEAIAVGRQYCVVQVIEREAARQVPPELEAELKLVAFRLWLDRQRSDATIERLVGQ